MLYGIALIILGLLAAPSMFLAKRPDAEALLNKLVPFQGWTGIVCCVLGIINLITTLLALSLLSAGMWGIILWVTSFAAALMMTVLGFILGYSLIVQYALSKNDAAREKGENALAKLRPIQGTLGLAGIIVGIWLIVCNIIYAAVVVAAVATA